MNGLADFAIEKQPRHVRYQGRAKFGEIGLPPNSLTKKMVVNYLLDNPIKWSFLPRSETLVDDAGF